MADRFMPAPEVAEVAERLMRTVPELALHRDADIVYLFNDREPKEGDEATHDVAGKAVKAPALWNSLTVHDFAIWIMDWVWRRLNPAQQEALVLHELLHIAIDEEGRQSIAKHDLEEFGEVVRRYGAWDESVAVFRRQLELFDHKVA